MVLTTDPLAANLVIVGTILIGVAFYVTMTFVVKRPKEELDKSFSYFLIVTGLYAAIYGGFFSLLWPSPMTGAYNILFGDPLAILGFVALASGFIILKKGDLSFIGILAFFAGIYSAVSGVAAYAQNMTKDPLIMMGMYVASGIAGILILPLVFIKNRYLAILVVIFLVLGALAALATGYPAVHEHLVSFASAHGGA